MRNIFILLFVALLATGCYDELDRPIIEKLTVDELRDNIRKDSSFVEFYKIMQELGSWVQEDELRSAQWGDVTYRRVMDYMENLNLAMGEIYASAREEYDLIYPSYDEKVDSIMEYWKNYVVENTPASYVDLEFAGIKKDNYYYSSLNEVYVGFDVTPLKGTVEQLRFKYEMKPKISNDGKFSYLDYSVCYLSSPVAEKETKYWKVDYTNKNRLENLTVEEVKRDYDFLIEVTAVRVDGRNIEDPTTALPFSVGMAMEYCTEGNNYYKDDIVKELLDPEYLSFWDYCSPMIEKKKKELDRAVYDLIEAYDMHDKNMKK